MARAYENQEREERLLIVGKLPVFSADDGGAAADQHRDSG